MISYENALAGLLAALNPTAVETVPVAQAEGRPVARDIHSPGDLPAFDNSAMDGYAVRSAEASEAGTRLARTGEWGAGSWPSEPLQAGTCARIFTGAPIPPGCDAVLMQEDAREMGKGLIEVLDPVRPWENVRFRGEDVRKGDLLLGAGRPVTPLSMALLLASGVAEVPVFARPRVAVASTGDELVEPGNVRAHGQVFDCNAAAIAALIRPLVPGVFVLPVIRDDLNQAKAAIESAFSQAEVLVTAGGASVGGRDVLRRAFEELGGKLHFWRIAMRPGKPFFHGELDGRHLFGLPGNPISALVTASLLVLPALRRLQGAVEPGPRFLPVRLSEPVSNPGDRRHFLRVTRHPDGSVLPAGVQASHILGALVRAEGLVDIPPGARCSAGEWVPGFFW